MPGVAMKMCALSGEAAAETLPLVGVRRTGETRGSPRKSDRRSGVGVANCKITPTRRFAPTSPQGGGAGGSDRRVSENRLRVAMKMYTPRAMPRACLLPLWEKVAERSEVG